MAGETHCNKFVRSMSVRSYYRNEITVNMGYVGYFLLFFVLSSVDASSRQKRVIGGKRYNDGDYKFHVSLWYMGKNNFLTAKTPDFDHTCGGSLIADQWVVTAGFCFEDLIFHGLENTSLWKVVLGMYDQRGAEKNGTFMEIDTIYHPPNYNIDASFGDIALLKLTEKAPLGERIGLVDYNTDPNCPEVDQPSVFIGWGQTRSPEVYGLGSDYPHEAVVFPTTEEYCHNVYEEPKVKKFMGGFEIDEKHICTGRKGGVGACYGDIGSPLLDECGSKTVVTGIMSTGYGCVKPGYPAIYTRVSSYSDWISKTIKENS